MKQIIWMMFFVCSAYANENELLKSELMKNKPAEVIYKDVNGDGKPDILEAWWNGKRCRWFDENGNMKSGDRRGDMFGDSLQVDMDGDGSYDGPEDMTVVWVDTDGDEMADLMTVAINPSAKQMQQQDLKAKNSLYMHFIDLDKDGVNHYIDWQTFDFDAWRHTGGCNFSPDYSGNSIFLKVHLPPWALKDPRYNWENPFLFYDFDDDGCTEMSIRMVVSPKKESKVLVDYPGKVKTCMVSMDLDNDSQVGREFSYDMTLQFGAKTGDELDYSDQVHSFPGLKAPAWVLPYYRYTNYREIDELIYTSHDRAYNMVMKKTNWAECDFQFDEDGDDHRWERVFVYENADPYEPRGGKNSMVSGPACDSLGDRVEFDSDFSGGGKLYIAPWDQKLHLYGAEKGAWLVDDGSYFGVSGNVPRISSHKEAPAPKEVVQYSDTDADGFIDLISYDYDGDKKIDLCIDLKKYNLPKPQLIDPAAEKWAGLHETFNAMAKQSWADAQLLYRAAWRAGLTDPELDELAIASSTWEKYDHGYWLKMKLFRKLHAVLNEEKTKQADLEKNFFTGDFQRVAAMIIEIGISKDKRE